MPLIAFLAHLTFSSTSAFLVVVFRYSPHNLTTQRPKRKLIQPFSAKSPALALAVPWSGLLGLAWDIG